MTGVLKDIGQEETVQIYDNNIGLHTDRELVPTVRADQSTVHRKHNSWDVAFGLESDVQGGTARRARSIHGHCKFEALRRRDVDEGESRLLLLQTEFGEE